MSVAGNGVRRYQLALGLLFVAVSAAYLLVVCHFGLETEAMRTYFPYADELVRGIVPETEYPPLALLFIAAPRLVADTPSLYNAVFVAEVCVFFMVGLAAMGKLAKRYNQSQRSALLMFTALMLLMIEFSVSRYDMFPAVLTLLSFYCMATKRYALAFALLAMATMTKVYPAVLFPIYLVPFLMNRDWQNAAKGTWVFFAAMLLIALPFVFLAPDASFHFVEYQLGRPLHTESVAGSFVQLASAMGLTDVSALPGYGSEYLAGPWPDAVATCLIPAVLAALAVIYAIYAYLLSRMRRDRLDNENDRMILLSGTVLLSLLTFILLGKALSPQYIIWAIPFVIFMLMTSIGHVPKMRIVVLSVAAIALTQAGFALDLVFGTPAADAVALVVLARNAVVIALFAYVLWTCKASIGRRRLRTQPPDA
ncbi:MAG: glycosyltransferase 87 family protein [Methanomassiliicoccaceae archaeon]|nr:glycosyltransferase 87 family protein [Methanomassiliicoccaceae archaeon]